MRALLVILIILGVYIIQSCTVKNAKESQTPKTEVIENRAMGTVNAKINYIISGDTLKVQLADSVLDRGLKLQYASNTEQLLTCFKVTPFLTDSIIDDLPVTVYSTTLGSKVYYNKKFGVIYASVIDSLIIVDDGMRVGSSIEKLRTTYFPTVGSEKLEKIRVIIFPSGMGDNGHRLFIKNSNVVKILIESMPD